MMKKVHLEINYQTYWKNIRAIGYLKWKCVLEAQCRNKTTTSCCWRSARVSSPEHIRDEDITNQMEVIETIEDIIENKNFKVF